VIDDLAGGLTKEAKQRVEASRKEFAGFLRELVAARRAHHDSSATDLISILMSAQDDDRLDEKELLGFCVLLLVAGFETTVNAVANGAIAFAENPDEWEKLRADPTLVKTAIEEMVRYDGPVQSFFRNTLAAAEVAGVKIPKGEKVMLTFASANRDERKYESPDAFRIDRRSPDHVGYGAGIHYCLGAPLARLELSTLWTAFLKRTKGFTLDGDYERTHNVLFRGARTLPIHIAPA
jgi:cytochrome P450